MNKEFVHLGEMFRMNFDSPLDVARNGGVISGGVISNGEYSTSSGVDDLKFPPSKLPALSSAFTFIFKGRVNFQSSSNNSTILAVSSGAGAFSQYAVLAIVDNQIFCRISNGSANSEFTSTATFGDGEYVHIHIVYDGSTLVVYNLGAQLAGTTFNFATGAVPFNLATEFVLGDSLPSNAALFSCTDLGFWNRAFSAQEVLDDYDGTTFTTPLRPVAFWSLDDKIGSSAFSTTELVQGANGTLLGTKPVKLMGVNGFSFSNGYIQSTPVNIPVGAKRRTIEVWARRGNLTGGSLLSCNAASGQKFILTNVQIAGTNYLFTDGLNPANNITVTDAQRAPIGQVAHHLFTFNENNGYKYYLNGKLVKSGTFPIAINTAEITSVTIGERLDVTFPFNGDIYLARIFDADLTPIQAEWLHSKGHRI